MLNPLFELNESVIGKHSESFITHNPMKTKVAD